MEPVLHPNEVDLRRIRRVLEKRRRYRYVTPDVTPLAGGYLVRSPCCSRNVDRAGGAIDIARIEFEAVLRIWRLYAKDHGQGMWRLESEHESLPQLLRKLNQDDDRQFWP